MILIIPIVIGAAAGLTAIFGVGSGLDGLSKQDKAKAIGKSAQKRYELKRKSVETASEVANDLAAKYGQLQIEVKRDTIGRFVAYIEKIGQRTSQSNLEFLEGLKISHEQFREYKAAKLEAGGSLAAGGGGMALGTIMLGGIAVGPALMIGGFALGGAGKKALTKARRYEAKANQKIADLDALEEFLKQLQRYIIEQKQLVESLNQRAINGLIKLESKPLPFDPQRDAAQFQQVALLVTALVEIIKTPILDAEGSFNPEAWKVRAKYRSL